MLLSSLVLLRSTVPTQPSGGGGGGAFTPEEAAQLVAQVAYIHGRLEAGAPGEIDDPVGFRPGSPPPPGVARVWLFLRNYDVAAPDTRFTVTMEARPPVAMGGAYEFDRVQKGETHEGEGFIDFYPSPDLVAAGHVDTYVFECPQIKLTKRVRLPPGESNIATLDAVSP